MKKMIAMLLALMMVLSLAACGTNTSPNTDSTTSQNNSNTVESTTPDETSSEETKTQNPVIGTWIGLYNGTILTFKEDNSFSMGSSNGTWANDDSSISVEYTTKNGGKGEMIFDISEADGTSVLRNREAGKFDGETTNLSVNDYYPEDKIQEVKQALAKNTGDMVSSDIIELTVNKAELAWYAQSPQYDSSTKKVTNLDAACAPSREGSFFKANKGRTLVCLDFTIKNTDRGTLNTFDNIITFTVIQNGKSDTVKGYDLNNEDGQYGMHLGFSAIAENGGDFFYQNGIRNTLIDADSTLRIKMVGIVSFDADLEAPFDLGVTIKNSSNGTDKYVYTIK